MYKPMHMRVGDGSAAFVQLGAANTPVAIPVPGTHDNHGRPHGFRIWFEDGDGAPVRGRLGLVGSQYTLPTVTDTNDQLGHIPATIEDQFGLPSMARNIIVASNTANAKVYVSWLYMS